MGRLKNDGRGRLGGRQPGSPNKITTSLREWIAQLIDGNREQMVKDLRMLEPLDRLKMLEKLMAYVCPKQAAVQTNIKFERLTEEQLKGVVEELTRGLEDGEESA